MVGVLHRHRLNAEALIKDRAKIEYLQGYVRKITEPAPPLGLKTPFDFDNSPP